MSHVAAGKPGRRAPESPDLEDWSDQIIPEGMPGSGRPLGKNSPTRRTAARASKHYAGHGVFVEEELVNRIEPMQNGEQRDEVEQPAVRPLHSSVPGQQEKAATDREPGQPRADLESENSKGKQDDSDGELFARKAPDEMLEA